MSDPLSLIDATAEQTDAAVVAIGEAQTGLRNRAPTGVLRGIWGTLALVARRIYDHHVTPMYTAADRQTATGPWLRMHAAYLGVRPISASAAQGSLQALSAAEAPVNIDAGTPITVQGSPQRLLVTAATQVEPGAASALPVRAETPGAAGNIAPGVKLTIETPGVTVSAPIDWITTPGADPETDDALRRRVDDRWASLGSGQPEAQYRFVAEGRPGIDRAIVVRTPRGAGSADLVLISTDPTGVPSAAQIADVTQALDDLRMICRDLQVLGGAIVPIRIAVLYEGGGYTPAQVAAAIEQGMDDVGAAGVVHVADIYTAAASGLPALTYFGVESPLHDVEIGLRSVPDITVTATMGRVPPAHVPGGAAGSGSGGPQPITDSLAYGVRTAAGVLTPQAPQAPIASGQWALAMPGLGSGDTWYFGPFPAGVELAGVEQYTADVTADWQLDAATGIYVYAHGATVPAGVQSDILVTARRTT